MMQNYKEKSSKMMDKMKNMTNEQKYKWIKANWDMIPDGPRK